MSGMIKFKLNLKIQKIELNNKIVPAISTKAIYWCLEIDFYNKVNYDDWINAFIQKYNLIENEDYIKITNIKGEADYILDILFASYICLFLGVFGDMKVKTYIYNLAKDYIRVQEKKQIERLIKIKKDQIGTKVLNCVNADDIKNYLDNRCKISYFDVAVSQWIYSAIEKYDFVKNIDYIVLKTMIGEYQYFEYLVTLDVAKKLAIFENNTKKAKKLKDYFIDYEKGIK